MTLIGAHTVGHVRNQFSGYGFKITENIDININAWDETPTVFDNKYYVGMIKYDWIHDYTFDNVSKPIFVNDKKHVMLGTDLLLYYNLNTKILGRKVNAVCGQTALNRKEVGCSYQSNDNAKVGRSFLSTLKPETTAIIELYANSNEEFLKAFAISFTKMTTVGYHVLEFNSFDEVKPTENDFVNNPKKIGKLFAIDLTKC